MKSPGRTPRPGTTTGDYGYSDEELEFLRAMDRFIHASGNQFPTYVEMLAVAKSLGYRKAEVPCPPKS